MQQQVLGGVHSATSWLFSLQARKSQDFFGFQHGKWGEGDHMWIPNHNTAAEGKDSKVYFRVIRGWLGILSFSQCPTSSHAAATPQSFFYQTMTDNDSHRGAVISILPRI